MDRGFRRGDLRTGPITPGGKYPIGYQRVKHRIGKDMQAIQPAEIMEDAAQIIGGRIRTAISPEGLPSGPGRRNDSRFKSLSHTRSVFISALSAVSALSKSPPAVYSPNPRTPPHSSNLFSVFCLPRRLSVSAVKRALFLPAPPPAPPPTARPHF